MVDYQIPNTLFQSSAIDQGLLALMSRWYIKDDVMKIMCVWADIFVCVQIACLSLLHKVIPRKGRYTHAHDQHDSCTFVVSYPITYLQRLEKQSSLKCLQQSLDLEFSVKDLFFCNTQEVQQSESFLALGHCDKCVVALQQAAQQELTHFCFSETWPELVEEARASRGGSSWRKGQLLPFLLHTLAELNMLTMTLNSYPNSLSKWYLCLTGIFYSEASNITTKYSVFQIDYHDQRLLLYPW